MREIRVFVSSPDDARFERQRLERVIARLNGELAGTAIMKAVRWETSFYKAHATFQAQIPEAAECDLVVAILRHRLGTELPDDFPKMPNGESYPSGTAYEVLSAMEASRNKGLPDVYVFRSSEPPMVRLDDSENRALVEEQWGRLRGFLQTWFLTPQGQFKAAFQSFASTDDFEAQVEKLLRQWIEEHILKGRSVVWPIEIKGSPFRGLKAFGARHAPVFFGRGRDTARAVDAWKDAGEAGMPFLLVIGPSGAGKSSLARAGLIPRLTAAGVVPSVDVWRVATMLPGERGTDPFAALAEELMRSSDSAESEDAGRSAALPEISESDYRSPKELAALLAHADSAATRPIIATLDRIAVAARVSGGYGRPVKSALLLLVDQLDELFAADVSDETRDKFATLLSELVNTGRVWLLATLRADLYERFLSVPALIALKQKGATYDLAPPGSAELAEIVREPAKAADIRYEADGSGRGLDERLLADADRADMLPLLQFTLNRLFDERETAEGQTRLTHAAYEAIGGLDGAIDNEAERALAGLSETEIARLPRLLREIAAPARAGDSGADSKALASLTIRSVPLARAAHDEPSRRLIKALVDARILLSSGEGGAATIRIAHQRVLESWKRAQRIVADNADFFRIREEVEDERRRWDAGGRTRTRLIPSGVPLAEAESIAKAFRDELPSETRAFIAASGNRARLRQRLTAAAALVFLGVAVAAGYMTYRAVEAGERAELGEMSALLAQQQAFELADSEREAREEAEDLAVAEQQARERAEASEEAARIAERIAQEQTENARVSAEAARHAQASAEEYAAAEALAREEAQQNFETARSTIDDIVFDLAQGLREVEGLRVQSIRRVLERVEQAVGNLTAADPENLDLQRSRAVMLNEFGDTYLAAGDGDAALAAYEESFEIGQRLAEADPANTKWQRDLFVSHTKIGDMQLGRGDIGGALASFEEALRIVERLSESEPDNAQFERDIAAAQAKLGDVRMVQGDLAGALESYRAALAIRDRLSAASPDDIGLKRDLALSHDSIGTVLVAQGDVAGALESYEAGRAIAAELAESDPENTQWQRDLSVSYNNVGDALVGQANLAGALESYRAGLAIRARLAAADPDNSQWQRDLAFSHDRIGSAEMGQGNLDAALQSYRAALKITQRLTEADPENTEWQRDLSIAFDSIGNILLAQEDFSGALESYEAGLAIAVALSEDDPANAEWQRDVAVGHNKVGDAKAAQQDYSGALQSFQASLAIVEKLIASNSDNATWQRDASVAYERLGDTHLNLGNLVESRESFEASLAIRRRLADANPENLQWQLDLVIGLYKVAVMAEEPRKGEIVEEAVALIEALQGTDAATLVQAGWADLFRGLIADPAQQ